jgi:hypothetical protein
VFEEQKYEQLVRRFGSLSVSAATIPVPSGRATLGGAGPSHGVLQREIIELSD